MFLAEEVGGKTAQFLKKGLVVSVTRLQFLF